MVSACLGARGASPLAPRQAPEASTQRTAHPCWRGEAGEDVDDRVPSRAHPRWRGGARAMLAWLFCYLGASPLARGSHEGEHGRSSTTWTRRPPAHPRWRGGAELATRSISASRGASPLARGSRPRLAGRVSQPLRCVSQPPSGEFQARRECPNCRRRRARQRIDPRIRRSGEEGGPPIAREGHEVVPVALRADQID